MNAGRNIQVVAQEVLRVAQTKKDYISPAAKVYMDASGSLLMDGTGVGPLAINSYAHGQIAEFLGIPGPYYKRCMEQPMLLAQNVNHWMQQSSEKRMLRTIAVAERPTLRALLGPGYRRLDNYDLLTEVYPFMMEEYGKPLVIESCEVTDTRFYLKVIAPHTEKDLNTLLRPGSHSFINEPVQSGFIVQNSEVGAGSISAFPFTKILRCTNGMTVEEFGQRRRHAGKRIGSGDEAQDADYFSDETKRLDDAAFWAKIKDTIRACLSDETVGKIFLKMAAARDMKIEKAPEEVVELASKNYGFNEAQKNSILRNLIDQGLGLNAYALSNAITAMAKDSDLDYDTASRAEKIGGDVISLSPSEWKTLAA